MEENKISVNFGVLVFLFLIFVAFIVVVLSFSSRKETLKETPFPKEEIKLNLGGSDSSPQDSSRMEVADLRIEDLTEGNGKEAQIGDKITVNYVGELVDGTEFDSSYKRGKSFSFVLGQGQVIQGWEKGILGMKEGGKGRLVIPRSLGYGARQVGSIPPNSTLVFEVKLLSLE